MPTWLRHLPAVLGLALLGGAVWVVQNEFRSLSLEDIKAALAAIPTRRLWAAFGLTLAAYAILTIYDRLGTIYAGRAVGYGRAAFASFCAYTLAHNIGFAAVSGAAVRYRLYAQWGLSPLQIGKVVAFCSLTFILGGLVLGGIVLLADPFVLPVLADRLPKPLMHGLGLLLLGCGVAYVALCGILRRVRVRGHVVDLPSWPMAVAQTLLASVDMAVTAAILHALLPPIPGLSFVGFVGIYVAAYLAGLLANIPGGIGIFDTAILLGLSPYLDAPSIVGGIVVFRLFYYVGPLFLAGFLFAGNEVLLRGRFMFARTATLPAVQTLARWSPPEFEVAAIASAVALCGALLLALGAIDALGDYSWLSPNWHLPDWAQALLGPASEFVPSLIGAALVVLSLALTRRATLAWGLTIALLLLGAAFTAARGADSWVPALLLAAVGLLAPFRRLFYRRARLFSGPLDASRAAGPLLLAGSVLILATYEPRLTVLAHTSWWQVVLSPDLPNTVRASVALAVLVGCIAIWRLVRPGRVVAQPWSAATDAALRALGGTSAPLPEALLWGDAGRAAIPLRRLPGHLLALGDPVGAHADRISAIWRLRDLAVQEGRHPAVWRAGPALRPVYADIGLSTLPLGADGLPGETDEAAAYLACRPELDLPALLPLLSQLAAESTPRMTLAAQLARLADACRRHAVRVVLAGLVLAVGSGLLAWARLGVSTDTDALFDAALPWRQREVAHARAFPQFSDLLIAVVEAETPEEAQATADALAAALSADAAHFTRAARPDAHPWFARNALLFLDEADLAALLDSTIDAQPFLGQLASDPSARGLFTTLALVAMGVERGEKLDSFRPALAGFAAALTDAAAGRPTPLSWQRLLGGKLADLAGPRRLVLAQARLDLGALEPGGAATAALRATAAHLPAVLAGRATIRLTGPVALADEEFATVAEGAGWGMAISTSLVLLWLILAVRSWRLILPIMATLGLGLAVTTGFAALAVGTLNLISVAFAVLFVGIAVDFAIQFCVRYREHRLSSGDATAALTLTAMTVGPQIVLAAVATAAGFLAFVPTSFRGVAELGLIAGAGMIVALTASLTVLPALLTLTRPRGEAAEVGYLWGHRAEAWLLRARWPVVAIFAAFIALGAALLPLLEFDSDPLRTKDPHTEAMATLAELMSDPQTSPYTADIMAASLAEAEALLPKLRALPLVAQAIALPSLVPADQAAKLPLVADAASILGATLAPRAAPAPVTPGDLRLAIRTAQAELDRVAPRLATDDLLARIAAALATLATAPDALLMQTNDALVRFLPAQLDALRSALEAGPVTLADLPRDLVRDWRAPDGRPRIQVTAKPEAHHAAGLQDFVADIRSIAPQAGGSAVTIVETASTIVGAFQTAAIGALLAIAVLLAAMLRRPLDVALTLGALLASALLTVAALVLLDQPLNFANIVALPLLLGVGVSFNIYFVLNHRHGARHFLGTATARAVLFSALTTATAFGALAASGHPGTASMGLLLLLSLAATLLVTFVLLPVLLAWNR